MGDFRSSTADQREQLNSTQGSGHRRSQPGIWTPYADGGIGIIPRRNLATPSLLRTSTSLQGMAYSAPMRLLTMMIDADVDASLAADNVLTLTTGDVLIVAMDNGAESDSAPNAVGTAIVNALFESLPPEIGGLEGLQSVGTLMTLCTGMSALECVPGEPLTGVRRIWPVDSLSLMMTRETADSDVEVQQRQNRISLPYGSPIYPGYVTMNPATFFWKPYQPAVDDPYGRATYSAALAELLCNTHMLQAIRDCVDHTAWPRGVVEIDTTALYEVATKHLQYEDVEGNPAATNWVLQQFQNMVSTVQTMKSDDWMVLGANGKAVMMQGGSFAGLENIMQELRSRIIRGLKQMPVMMAAAAGKTEGHTSVEWQVFARRLEMIRAHVLAPILKAVNLHLRLLGLNLVAVAKYQPIRTTDALVEAQTEAMRIKNEAQKILLGWINNDSACLAITGKGPTGTAETLPGALLMIAGGPPPETGPTQAGGTQEEADAQEGVS